MTQADLLSAPLDDLLAEARRLRPGPLVTYSPKVFVPLTTLCRDVCGYCTFARPPRRGERAFMTEDEVLAIARAGAAAGCREALFTLGDRPELRYKVARDELRALGCETTLDYLARCARLVLDETGLLPHLNPGVMTREELAALRPVSASMGIMLETTADRLGETRRAALGLAGQDPGAPAGDDPARGRARDSLHQRDPHRDRGDARGADRRASLSADCRWRASAGGHRPELQSEAGDADGVASRAVARRPSLDDCRGQDRARPALARAGAAEPRVRRLPAAARRRDRRLGRRLSRDDRPRESRGAVAGDRAARGSNPEPRARARAAASRLPGVRRRARALGRSRGRAVRTARRPTPPGSRATTRGRPASRAASRSCAATPFRSGSRATTSARTSSRGCSPPAARSCSACSRPRTGSAARRAATR